MTKAQRPRKKPNLAQYLYPSSPRKGAAGMSETLDDLTEDWAAVKLIPLRTGLPRAVWITENQGYPHDVRVKVSRLRSGRGTWLDALSVTVRPTCEEIVPAGQPELPAADLALVRQWVELNRDVIIDFWDGAIDYLEAGARLQKLP
jgi:hypothetical protein